MDWKSRRSPSAPGASPSRRVGDQLESAERRTGLASGCSESGWNDAVFNTLVLAELSVDCALSASAFAGSSFRVPSLVDSSLADFSSNQAVIKNTGASTNFQRARTNRRGAPTGVRRKARTS